MDLTKFIFRPIRGGLNESLRLAVSFDDYFQLFDYMYSTYGVVPHLIYYGFDERISWNTFIVTDYLTGNPYGFVHFPHYAM